MRIKPHTCAVIYADNAPDEQGRWGNVREDPAEEAVTGTLILNRFRNLFVHLFSQ
jgi:hypothetical protein